MVFKSLEQKFDLRTHHNALRLSSVSHQTMGLAQARPNNWASYGVTLKISGGNPGVFRISWGHTNPGDKLVIYGKLHVVYSCRQSYT